jgi:hypothetical protein
VLCGVVVKPPFCCDTLQLLSYAVNSGINVLIFEDPDAFQLLTKPDIWLAQAEQLLGDGVDVGAGAGVDA